MTKDETITMELQYAFRHAQNLMTIIPKRKLRYFWFVDFRERSIAVPTVLEWKIFTKQFSYLMRQGNTGIVHKNINSFYLG